MNEHEYEQLVEDVLTPNRETFHDVAIDMRLIASSADAFTLDYTINFSIESGEVLFGIAETPLVAETLHTLTDKLSECTVLLPGERMTDARSILRGVEISTTRNGRVAEGEWRVIDRDDLHRYVDPSRSLDLRRVALAEAVFPVSVPGVNERRTPLRPMQIRMRRKVPYSAGGLPWVSDRLLFLRSLRLDYSRLSPDIVIKPQMFMARYAGADSVGRWDHRDLRFEVNAWLVSGQGIMFSWRRDV